MNRQFVSIGTPDGPLPAYLCEPAAGGAPGVLVLQEIFGLTPFIKGVCERLARSGFAALAPDLFWRQEPGVVLEETERERAGKFMNGLDAGLALDDCDAALAHLRALPSQTGATAALGYCLGGKFAYLLATRGSVDAAISYYGVGIHALLGEAAALSVPTLLHIAAEDALCPPAAQEDILTALAVAPRPATMEVHAGVGHAFARTGSPAYREAAAARADAQTLAFLRAHLGDAGKG